MKFSIGEIVDRLSICRLKSERLSLDNSKEMSELYDEMNTYEGIYQFYDDMYKINGGIWDLESDIRRGNEDTLGLEEVGRRALKIRELNNLRVNLKNEINSKFNEGFIEVKMNHGSEKTPDVVVTLTTVPERLLNLREDGLKNVIKNLCEQNYNGYYEVHFNIPVTYSVTNELYVLPEWIDEFKLKYPHLKIFRTKDFGPPTKFVPTIMRLQNPEIIVLTVDDDLIYHREMVSEHKKYQDLLKDSVICYEGRGCEKHLFGSEDIRDSWILCVTEIRQTHSLQHFKSASYKVKLFDQDFYDYYLGKTLSDDVLISRYLRDKKIKMFVVPYEKDKHLYETRELWDKHQGVVSFPIIRQASSVEGSGCNHPEILKIQPKFYEPNDLGMPSIRVTYDTDKFSHGYIPIYESEFQSIKDAKNVLEIGVYQGGSLQYLKDFFPEATIYGLDLNNNNHLNSDRIKTFVCNQEKLEDLENFISKIDCEFDLIIDDGGHTMRQQQLTFGVLFKKVRPGGYYVIEDLHTSNMSQYISPEDKITSLEMLENFKKTGILESNYISDNEKEYIENNIESLGIWSRTPEKDLSVTSIIKKLKKKRLVVHQPTNFYSSRIRYHSIFWQNLIEKLDVRHQIITNRFAKDCHKGIGKVKLESDNSENDFTLNVLECEMIIEDYDTKEIYVLSCADNLSEATINLQDKPNLKKVFVSQFIDEKITSHIKNENLHKYSPWTYFPFNEFDLDSFYEKRKQKENLIPKMFFSGDIGSRPILNNFSKDFMDFFGYLGDFDNYVENLINYEIAFSVAGRGELCYRDVECMAMGVPLIRFEYLSKMEPNLIPNFHYISVERPEDLKSWMKLDREGNEHHAELITRRFQEVIEDKEFLNFISNNARKYYEDYLCPESVVNNTLKLLNL
jgi:hypothetical protein